MSCLPWRIRVRETEVQLNRVTQDELVDIIFAKGRTSERNDYGKFWPDTGEWDARRRRSSLISAAKLPGRPVKYVRDAAMRMYNPDGHKGAWTKDEDQKLRMSAASSVFKRYS